MSSESGLEGSEGQSVYAATKNAVNSLTRSWAKELGKQGVRVVGVAPGIMEATGLRTLAYESALAYTRGITVDDCEVVSRRFSDILDEKDYIEDSYIFEVSSPGLGRPLKKEKDFIRSVGQEVEIRTYRAINRQKEFVGILKEFDQNTVTISYEDDSTQTFEKSEIALIRLALDF